MWDPDTRWVGNEAGVAPFPCFNEVDSLDFSIQTTKKDKLDKKIFLPAECDCRMRSENWFFSENDEHTVKSLDELIGLYYYSVGRGANLLINIGPDRNGKLPEKDIKHLSALGNEIKRRFDNPIFDIDDFTQEKDTFTLKLDSPKLINHVLICEDLTDGESVLEFRISVKPFPYGENIVVYEGKNIGHKAICEFKTIYANKVVVEILKTVDTYRLEKLNVYYVD
jgi:alpha-L-fucosidase